MQSHYGEMWLQRKHTFLSRYKSIQKSWKEKYCSLGFLVAQRLKRLPAMRETGFDSWVRKIPWRRKWQSTPVFLPGESHGQRSLVGFSPLGHKEYYTLLVPKSFDPLALDFVCKSPVNLFSKWKFLSCFWVFATPWTIQSMEFSRPEYWSG